MSQICVQSQVDLCVGVVCAPIMTYLCWEIHHGYMDAFMDHWTWRLSNLFTMATVANTLLLNVDRYIAIVHPLRFLWSQRRRLCIK